MGETGSSGASGSWSREPEDLTEHWDLEQCDTIEFEGVVRPFIGKTALLAELGRGGMGIVYFGVNPRLNTEVAVKVLPKSIQRENHEAVERFMREARLAARLESAHLVRVLDVDKDEKSGAHYIVMEYVRGKSAREWMDDFKLEKGAPEKKALEVVIAATKGLKTAHLEGILHRDVKPHNILIPADDAGRLLTNHAKLTDLGLARHESNEDEITSTQMGMGTPGYTAPEQATDARTATKRSDVFGAGATLYALLTNKRPYTGKNPVDAIINTMKGRYKHVEKRRPNVSNGTAALIGRCLLPEPEARFADAASLLDALRVCHRALTRPAEAAAAEQAVIELVTRKERGKRVAAAIARNTPGRPLRPLRRRRATNNAVTVGLIALVVAAAGYFLYSRLPGNGAGAAAPQAGGLSCDSTPPGATVSVNGEVKGVTPLVLDGLVGSYDVELRLAGYKPHTLRALDVVPGVVVRVSPALQKIQRRARMNIASTPSGAIVRIDGKRHGNTPLSVPGLAFGSHTIEVRLDKYETYEQVHVLAEGQTLEIAVDLRKLAGKLTLVDGPPGAVVKLTRGKRSWNLALDANGALTVDLAGGTYALTITRADMESVTDTVTIGAGAQPDAHISIERQRWLGDRNVAGALTVDSAPSGCAVRLNGVPVGKTPLRAARVPSGKHRLTIDGRRHAAPAREVEIRPGKTLELGTIQLQAVATVDLSQLPRGARAMLDGAQIRDGARLEPGPRKIMVTRTGYIAQYITVVVQAGAVAVVKPSKWIRRGARARFRMGPLPKGARAFVDGKDVTGSTIVRAKPKEIVVAIRRPGYEDVVVRRTLKMDQTLTLPEQIAWRRIETRLDLSGQPRGATLRIDRKDYAHGDIVPRGEHKARFVIGGRRGKTVEFHVGVQKTARPVLPRITAKPVVRALAWLSDHQDNTGNWNAMLFNGCCPPDEQCTHPASRACDIGVSSLALLCFLRAGNTHQSGRYRPTVRRGLTALTKRQRKDGAIFSDVVGDTYHHGYASLALVEAYAMTQDDALRGPAQRAVSYIVSRCTKDGGWRYFAGEGSAPDTSVTGLMVEVLTAAEGAGLAVDRKVLDAARDVIARMTDPKTGRVGYLTRGGPPFRQAGQEDTWPLDRTESMTAVGNTARLLLGTGPKDKNVVRGARRCLRVLPRWSAASRNSTGWIGSSTIDMYYWYYGSLLAYHLGGLHQKTWDRVLRKALLKHQHKKGHLAGSWDACGPFGSVGGRIYATAMCCLALECGYRTQSLK